MRPIIFTGTKGGVGTTTMLCCLAARAIVDQPVTILDLTGTTDVAGSLGLPADVATGHDRIDIVHLDPEDRDEVVAAVNGTDRQVLIDGGLGQVLYLDAKRVVVTTNSYIALRRGVMAGLTIDELVLLPLPGHCLGTQDIESVFGRVPIIISPDDGVKRASDAGLLIMRPPRGYRPVVADHLLS